MCIDAFSPTLAKIIETGGVRNQFETGTSSMILSSKIRGETEKGLFGIPMNAPGSAHPVYWWIGENPHQWSDDMAENGAYGDVTIVLKRAVKTRTTMMGDDSLGAQVRQTQAASPMTAPSWTSVSWASAHLPSGDVGDPLELKGLSDPKKVTGGLFTEAQIHGGVTLDDISRVVVSKQTPKSTLDQLTKAGIPWECRKVDYSTGQ